MCASPLPQFNEMPRTCYLNQVISEKKISKKSLKNRKHHTLNIHGMSRREAWMTSEARTELTENSSSLVGKRTGTSGRGLTRGLASTLCAQARQQGHLPGFIFYNTGQAPCLHLSEGHTDKTADSAGPLCASPQPACWETRSARRALLQPAPVTNTAAPGPWLLARVTWRSLRVKPHLPYMLSTRGPSAKVMPLGHLPAASSPQTRAHLGTARDGHVPNTGATAPPCPVARDMECGDHCGGDPATPLLLQLSSKARASGAQARRQQQELS